MFDEHATFAQASFQQPVPTLLIVSIIHVCAKPTCKTLIFNLVPVVVLIHSKNCSFVVEKLSMSGSIVSCRLSIKIQNFFQLHTKLILAFLVLDISLQTGLCQTQNINVPFYLESKLESIVSGTPNQKIMLINIFLNSLQSTDVKNLHESRRC